VDTRSTAVGTGSRAWLRASPKNKERKPFSAGRVRHGRSDGRCRRPWRRGCEDLVLTAWSARNVVADNVVALLNLLAQA
jgi:hypothetical protein